MPRRITSSAGGLLAVLLLTACSGKVLTTDGAVVLVSERPSAGMDALGGGRLEVIDGCLGAGGAVIVWPFRTTIVDHDPLTIEIPDDGVYALGDDVQVSGGYVLEQSSTARVAGPFEVSGVTVPAACAEHDVFLAH